MSKRVNNNNLTIDGGKLKKLLEESTGKTIKELSLDNGYSDSFLRMACKSNRATPAVQTLARMYGISPEAYILKENEPVTETAPETAPGQISITDYTATLSRDELKEIVKEAVKEVWLEIYKARR